jgi:hypothetical protein
MIPPSHVYVRAHLNDPNPKPIGFKGWPNNYHYNRDCTCLPPPGRASKHGYVTRSIPYSMATANQWRPCPRCAK